MHGHAERATVGRALLAVVRRHIGVFGYTLRATEPVALDLLAVRRRLCRKRSTRYRIVRLADLGRGVTEIVLAEGIGSALAIRRAADAGLVAVAVELAHRAAARVQRLGWIRRDAVRTDVFRTLVAVDRQVDVVVVRLHAARAVADFLLAVPIRLETRAHRSVRRGEDLTADAHGAGSLLAVVIAGQLVALVRAVARDASTVAVTDLKGGIGAAAPKVQRLIGVRRKSLRAHVVRARVLVIREVGVVGDLGSLPELADLDGAITESLIGVRQRAPVNRIVLAGSTAEVATVVAAGILIVARHRRVGGRALHLARAGVARARVVSHAADRSVGESRVRNGRAFARIARAALVVVVEVVLVWDVGGGAVLALRMLAVVQDLREAEVIVRKVTAQALLVADVHGAGIGVIALCRGGAILRDRPAALEGTAPKRQRKQPRETRSPHKPRRDPRAATVASIHRCHSWTRSQWRNHPTRLRSGTAQSV